MYQYTGHGLGFPCNAAKSIKCAGFPCMDFLAITSQIDEHTTPDHCVMLSTKDMARITNARKHSRDGLNVYKR